MGQSATSDATGLDKTGRHAIESYQQNLIVRTRLGPCRVTRLASSNSSFRYVGYATVHSHRSAIISADVFVRLRPGDVGQRPVETCRQLTTVGRFSRQPNYKTAVFRWPCSSRFLAYAIATTSAVESTCCLSAALLAALWMRPRPSAGFSGRWVKFRTLGILSARGRVVSGSRI